MRTTQDNYWCLSNGGGIQASGNRRCADALFELVWHGDGSVSFRANNGKYLATKRSGHLFATSESIEDVCKFFFYLINRPVLVLKCEQGFVGLRHQSKTKLECNKATYETILVERANKGLVYFKGRRRNRGQEGGGTEGRVGPLDDLGAINYRVLLFRLIFRTNRKVLALGRRRHLRRWRRAAGWLLSGVA